MKFRLTTAALGAAVIFSAPAVLASPAQAVSGGGCGAWTPDGAVSLQACITYNPTARTFKAYFNVRNPTGGTRLGGVVDCFSTCTDRFIANYSVAISSNVIASNVPAFSGEVYRTVIGKATSPALFV